MCKGNISILVKVVLLRFGCLNLKIVLIYRYNVKLKRSNIMQLISTGNKTISTCCDGNSKQLWHRPSVSRIDIKRTLSGTSGTSDGDSPSNPT
jgi:hypothetical protein